MGNAAAASVMPDTDFNSAEFEYSDVRKYIIKGVWYFDRISTELKYRPIAIGPVAVSAEDKYAQTNDDTGSAVDSDDDVAVGEDDSDNEDEPDADVAVGEDDSDNEEEAVADEAVGEDDSDSDSFAMTNEMQWKTLKKNTDQCFGFFIQKQETFLARLMPSTKRTCLNLFLLTV